MKTTFAIAAVAVLLIAGCAAPQHSREAVYLTSHAGKEFVADQLNSFQVDAQGTIGGPNEGWISLYNTSQFPFRLSGSVWLEGPPKKIAYPGDMPDGVGFFIRARDGMHRYSITPGSLVVKRRKHSGGTASSMVTVTKFEAPARKKWLEFELESTANKITFRIGDQYGEISGPLDMDGGNAIALAQGSRLKDVRLEILPKSRRMTSAMR